MKREKNGDFLEKCSLRPVWPIASECVIRWLHIWPHPRITKKAIKSKKKNKQHLILAKMRSFILEWFHILSTRGIATESNKWCLMICIPSFQQDMIRRKFRVHVLKQNKTHSEHHRKTAYSNPILKSLFNKFIDDFTDLSMANCENGIKTHHRKRILALPGCFASC